MMNRHTNKMSGFVNFPVNSNEYKSTCEGGMFVSLIVKEKKFGDWCECCRADINRFNVSEILINDDTIGSPELESYETKEYDEYVEKRKEYIKKFKSCLLCSMTIGTTGWSGSREIDGYWHCTYDDLTDDGKKLYDMIKKLYSNCEIYLLTWLDT